MRKNNMLIGILLLGLGVFALLNSFNIISYSLELWRFWPFFILIPGLIFEISYFNSDHRLYGLLMPGGILTTIGSIFMICSLLGWNHMVYLWPWFAGSVGVGFMQMYLFGNRDRVFYWLGLGFIGPAVFSSIVLLFNIKGSMIFPGILIIVGGVLLLNSREKDRAVYKVSKDKEEGI